MKKLTQMPMLTKSKIHESITNGTRNTGGKDLWNRWVLSLAKKTKGVTYGESDSKIASTIAASIVHSKLDYCNYLSVQSDKSQINHLQQIQNCLAPLHVLSLKLLNFLAHPSSGLCTNSRLPMQKLQIQIIFIVCSKAISYTAF